MRVLDRFFNCLRNKVRLDQHSEHCIEKGNQFYSKKQNLEKGLIQVKRKLSRQNGMKFILHYDSRHLLITYHLGCHTRELYICLLGDYNMWKIFLENSASGQIIFTLSTKQINYHPREISCCFCFLGCPSGKSILSPLCSEHLFSAAESMREIAKSCLPWIRMGLWPNISLLDTFFFEHGSLKEIIPKKKRRANVGWRTSLVAFLKKQLTNSDHDSPSPINFLNSWSFSKPDSTTFPWNLLDSLFSLDELFFCLQL